MYVCVCANKQPIYVCLCAPQVGLGRSARRSTPSATEHPRATSPQWHCCQQSAHSLTANLMRFVVVGCALLLPDLFLVMLTTFDCSTTKNNKQPVVSSCSKWASTVKLSLAVCRLQRWLWSGRCLRQSAAVHQRQPSANRSNKCWAAHHHSHWVAPNWVFRLCDASSVALWRLCVRGAVEIESLPAVAIRVWVTVYLCDMKRLLQYHSFTPDFR